MSDFTRQHLDQPSNVGGSDFGSRKEADNSKGRLSPGASFGDRQAFVKPVDGKFGEKWQAPEVSGKFEKKNTSND